MLLKTNKHWWFSGIALLGLSIAVGIIVQTQSASNVRAASGEVVMLDTTLHTTLASGRTALAPAFVAAGKTVVLKTAAQWGAMTTADFAAFDAVVLGDPTCAVGTTGRLKIAEVIANASTWGAAVDGNVILIGTDEQWHSFPSQGGTQLMADAAAFPVAEAGKTGAYVSLSCYYHGTAANTPVPMLDDAFGSAGDFTMTGVGCFNTVKLVATHPALTGITNAILSDWSCSVHEAFDKWPITFEVLAIAQGIGSVFTAPDGTVGTPYILARGVTVISDIDLSPDGVTNNVGETHTVTALVEDDSGGSPAPVLGTTVSSEVIAGPHAGENGTDVTDGAGEATFSYVGAAVGTDAIEATFVDAAGRTQRSNPVRKHWVDPTPVPPTSTPVPPTPTPEPQGGMTGGGSVPTPPP